ncbi:MAG: c-type cytochrome [Acidobacteria bacterium]|nr:c-type cytochrome [Acidobacteriota bacterium]
MTPPFDPVADALPLLGHQDRYVRYAGRQLLRRVNRNHWRDAAMALTTPPAASEAQLVLAQTIRVPTAVPPMLDRQLALLQAGVPDEALPGLLRAMHLTMIRAEGVRHTAPYAAIGAALLARFPVGRPLVDRELARTLAFLDTPDALPKLVAYMTAPATHREDQIFTMYCLHAMRAGWEPAERKAVVQWFLASQEQRWRGGASFIGYMKDFWEHFLTVLPPDERQAAEDVMPSFQPNVILTSSGRPAPPGEDTARLSQQELREYLTLDPMAYAGDATRGERVFDKALCSACHRSGTLGQEAGPDLTAVAQRFARTDLLDAILTPSKAISEQWASVEVATRDKKVTVGVIVSETANALTLQPIGGAPVSIPISQILSRKAAAVSPMPEGLLNVLTLREIADLLAFLERTPGP